jgi:enterochelin esterase family protein
MKLLYILCAAGAVLAQAPQPRPNSYRTQAQGTAARPRLISPEVHSDRRITFRIRAPQASEVSLVFGAWNPKPQAMSKDESGVWSLTIGPVEPEIYTYSFLVNGLKVLDSSNPTVKTGNALDASVVEVPGTPPRFDEVQNVPHGAIHVRTYNATALGRQRSLYVYVPPEYDKDPARKFPVLYLRHGGGDVESNWSADGRAGIILENLIAQQKAVPMLIAMTNGNTDGTWAGGSSPQGMAQLEKELMADVLPFVERNYRVLPGRENRAITGLSMGGGQAFTMGLRNLDQFAWVGEFSSGLISDADFDLNRYMPGFLSNASEVNRKLRLFYLSCGTDDPRFAGQQNLVDLLKQHDIRATFVSTPGGHEWKVWRHLLADFLVRIFRPQS